MTSPEPALLTMSRPDLDLAMDWAAAEGWNPGLHDADAFHAADPDGFLLARLAGEPVAMISAVAYGTSFGFIGFYIVRPEYRGRGYGWRIWQAAMARLAGRNIGLDGVVAQQDNYRKSGFRLAHRNVRYQGVGGTESRLPPRGMQLVPLSQLPFAAVVAYDRDFFAAERTAFLRAWIAQPGSVALGLVENQALIGYGVRRACRSGYKIGPLFADTAAGAEALFQALSAGVEEGAPLFLDVPECNAEAVALAARHGLEPVFETARMYTGTAPEVALGRTYGITSFELG